MSTPPPRREKIYCDKWIHEGVCAFTQVGCKYKHEMPFDRATQLTLGLNHGIPHWYRRAYSLTVHPESPLPFSMTSPPSSHEGVCAFTQVGCKYKHEMPFDRATQLTLGLNHGIPHWYRRAYSLTVHPESPLPFSMTSPPSSGKRSEGSWRRLEGPPPHYRRSGDQSRPVRPSGINPQAVTRKSTHMILNRMILIAM